MRLLKDNIEYDLPMSEVADGFMAAWNSYDTNKVDWPLDTVGHPTSDRVGLMIASYICSRNGLASNYLDGDEFKALVAEVSRRIGG